MIHVAKRPEPSNLDALVRQPVVKVESLEPGFRGQVLQYQQDTRDSAANPVGGFMF